MFDLFNRKAAPAAVVPNDEAVEVKVFGQLARLREPIRRAWTKARHLP